MKKFRFPEDGDVAADIRERYGFDGDLLDIYANNEGVKVHKWHHYLPLYDRYFSRYRGTPVKFLEIGVNNGGSLQMWRRYFGKDAVICGIDINPACAQYDGQSGMVRIGSQDDPAFLAEVVAEMGGVDVVLDDGSHRMPHVDTSLKVLFPLLTQGGTYMIEDLHTAYYPRFGGGFKAPGNFFNTVRKMIDDMHMWYHHKGKPRLPELAREFSGIHVHDSIVVIDKAEALRPTHSRVQK
ncbi:class I SAM-dependent methyltransferase [Lentibacter sp. XHP0401]|jgi:Methyltransferase domain|uniref:class I SAM-dependent methyltransferase n=1 Tax=Lentibacter sp. XHP0401 TaxID=2984334 RepID=UPI0021E6EB86|nr:class I SAM-dependent methyltransferase [Lentibacter sp. XHP0401]MCV2894750.1 class I SAM-dependent methyltransferase [Lentibacter sp. XHP0401]